MRFRVCVLGTAALIAATAAAPVSAAPAASTFALTPQHYDPSLRASQSYFIAVARPGETFTNSVRVRNVGAKAGTALLYAVDATTGRTSGAVYLGSDKPRRGVGAWITLGVRSVTLGPGQSTLVPITVHVPAGTRPGDHLGGIVAENKALTQASGHGALRIRIRHLTIAAALVQIPGPAATRIDATGLRAGGEHGYQYVYMHLKNLGALATKPYGRVLITSVDGKTAVKRAVRLDTFLPESAIDYPVLLTGHALRPGTYRAAVDLAYAASPLGYRRTAGPLHRLTRSFGFVVSAKQYTKVFRGVLPVAAPAQATSHSPGRLPLLLVVAGGLAALLAVLVLVFVGVRRWTAGS